MTNEVQGVGIDEAFELAAKKCGGKPQMLAALNISESWMYTCIRNANVPLKTGLKLQILTGGKYKWQNLCPIDSQEVSDVKKYMI